MKKPRNFFDKLWRLTNKHSAEILACGAIIGMASTTVLAVKATPEAIKLIDKAREKKGSELTQIEKIKAGYKPYIPAIVSGSAAALCVVGINSIHAKRYSALMTAYQISSKAFSDYREATIETVGEKKEKEIRSTVNQKKLEEHPASSSTIYVTGGGNTKIYDTFSDRYFESDIDKIKKAKFDLNERMQKGMEMNISLNEFYSEIGVKPIPIGDEMGWTSNNYIDIAFDAKLTDKGDPCITMDFLVPPDYGYRDVYY